MTGWDGDELRIGGHSLGSQVAVGVSAKMKTDSSSNYGDKLQRIFLLDHFFGNGGRDFLPQSDPGCSDWWWWPCSHIGTGEYVREYVMEDIRNNGNVPVIENYRSSWTSSNPFIGDENSDLNEMTVFVELKPWFYYTLDFTAKHMAALQIYVHCMKWEVAGEPEPNAPTCRMSTEELQTKCQISSWNGKCQKRYVQDGDDSAYTTWDYDDSFAEYAVKNASPVPRNFDIEILIIMMVAVAGLLCFGMAVMLRRNNKKYESVKWESDSDVDMEHISDQ